MKQTFAFRTLPSMLKQLLVAGIFATTLVSVMPAQANNPAPSLKADAPNRYEVKKGDTLWDLSGRYLKSPEQWRRIWAANKQVKNPHLIYPGDILLLCVIQGETLVGIDTGAGCAGIERDMQANNTNSPTAAPSQNITITPLNDSIPAIPLSAIASWLDKVLIVSPDDFDHTPYVLASKKSNLVTGAGDTVYATGVPLIPGQRYGIYRKGEPYIDPATKNTVGIEVTQVASGIVSKVAANGVSSIDLLESYGSEVREGDRVFVELADNIRPVFYPKPANVNRGGQIIRVMDSISSAAVGGVIAINLGYENGAEAGDVLTVYNAGALVRDIYDNVKPVRLPSEQTGHVMVFKTFNKISYAYVLDSELPLKVGDKLLPATGL